MDFILRELSTKSYRKDSNDDMHIKINYYEEMFKVKSNQSN